VPRHARRDIWERRIFAWLMQLRLHSNSEIVREVCARFENEDGSPLQPGTVYVDLSPSRMASWLPRLRERVGIERTFDGVIAYHEHLRDVTAAWYDRETDPYLKQRLGSQVEQLNESIFRMNQEVGRFPRLVNRESVKDDRPDLRALARRWVDLTEVPLVPADEPDDLPPPPSLGALVPPESLTPAAYEPPPPGTPGAPSGPALVP
jgi:hypothetical protein